RRELPTNVARPVDVGLECDGSLCASDRSQHHWEDFVAIAQDFRPIAADEGRSKQCPQFVGKSRVIQGIRSLNTTLDLLLTTREVDGEEDTDDREQHRPRDEHGRPRRLESTHWKVPAFCWASRVR